MSRAMNSVDAGDKQTCPSCRKSRFVGRCGVGVHLRMVARNSEATRNSLNNSQVAQLWGNNLYYTHPLQRSLASTQLISF